ncbi:hypothetical protein FC682_23080 [Peribacillus simplex]|uniref:hypothetical protein n=1 Tax=Peribacillus simplex TaxID=1478 RepID=UPI0010BF5300|nr:hypothetical protein [Peribacillus simplex]TKH01450.1 hypothetical protein FC682_23080 [Peribacillus simplex]
MNYDFDITFRIGKDNSTKDVQKINITDKTINMFGSLYGESQILDLGNHFNLYHLKGKKKWRLRGGSTPLSPHIPSGILLNLEKKPGTSVSGNFGEVLTILILKKLFLPKKLTICHLKSKKKCPDLMLDSSVFDTYYSSSKTLKYSLPSLPDILLGECKNTNFPEALTQLATIWYEMGDPSVYKNPLFGFGVISNLYYKTNPPKIRFSIISPVNRTALYKKLNDAEKGIGITPPGIKNMKINDFKGGLLYGIK